MSRPIRVLIVDDSAFARMAISGRIRLAPEIEVVGAAVDGIDALDKVKRLRPDVVTLDVEMPRMDGLTTLDRIMLECPTPVVMLSRLTDGDTETAIKALEAGAIDFFLKPSLISSEENSRSVSGLIDKIRLASKVDISRVVRMLQENRLRSRVKKVSLPRPPKLIGNPLVQKKVVVIGSSTGGPRALCDIIPNLPGDIQASIIIVQHMPPGFTKSLARRLDYLSLIEVKEAEPGDVLRVGQALVAPGNYHLTLGLGNKIDLNQMPSKHGVRPAVDVTMESAASLYGYRCIGVVLTGMGSDGQEGASAIKKSGGKVIVQDESTSVVYGMPKSVVESGCADKIMPLPQIAPQIVGMCHEPITSKRELKECGT